MIREVCVVSALLANIAGCGDIERGVESIESIIRTKKNSQSSEPKQSETPPWEEPNKCSAPPEWNVALCVGAPSVSGKFFSRAAPRQEISEGDSASVDIGKSDFIWFRNDHEVEFVVGKNREIVRSCYQQQGGCLNIKNYWHGSPGFLPVDHSFAVERDGATIVDVPHQIYFYLHSKAQR